MIREIKNGTLYFDGCNTVDLAEKYNTPLYVVSETEIVRRFDELKDCFVNRYERTRVAYASKAFSTLAMYKLCQREGMCIDVVSGGELFTAISCDFPAQNIEFNGNNKSYEELEMAIDYGVGRIIVDGLTELDMIEEICKTKAKIANVLYRITPGVRSDSHDYIVTGRKDSKFGIPLDEHILYPYIERAISSPCIDFKGFHFHVGSQLHDNSSHLQALDILLHHVTEVKRRFDCEVQELNLGGGFGVTYTDEERKPFSYFLEPMMEKIEGFFAQEGMKRPAIVIEPGRSIVAEAGISLYRVGQIKNIPDLRTYVSVDGGMTDNIRPALYGAKYSAVIAGRADEPAETEVTICGKCCESGDILIKDLFLPKVEQGDILAVFSTGAYGYSMASNYNKNPIPAVVFVKEGRSEVIVKRQTYQDLIKNEVLPERLTVGEQRTR